MVVFPEDSGPKISTTRPRGKPPTPSAASNEIAPVGITEIGTMASFDPSRMMEPLPNCFSICANARSILLAINAAVRPGSRIYHPNYKESLENMKKLLTLLFAAALTLSLSSAAFAQDTSSSAPADKKEAKAEKKAAKKEKKAAKKEKKAEKKDEMKKDEPK